MRCPSVELGGSAWRCRRELDCDRAAWRGRASRGSASSCRRSTRPRNLREVLPTLPPVHEVILVDGGSVDGTVETARELLPGIITLTQMRRGKGNALAAGFAKVTGDVVVMFDADGSADPAEIPRFVEALVDGADFAKGSRFRAGRRQRRHHAGAPAGQPVPPHVDEPLVPHPVHRPLLRLQRVLGRPDPAARPARPRAGRARRRRDAVGRRLRDRDADQLPVRRRRARPSPRCPASSAGGIHGESNLRAVSDGLRVLRTLRTERARVQARTRRSTRRLLGQSPDGWLGASGTIPSVTRVGMITTRAQPEIGGIESHVAEVAVRIAARGYDLELLTTDRSGRLPKREGSTATRSAGSAPTRPAATGTSAPGCSGPRCARGTT